MVTGSCVGHAGLCCRFGEVVVVLGGVLVGVLDLEAVTLEHALLDRAVDDDRDALLEDATGIAVVHGEIQEGVLQGDRLEVKHSDEYAAENDENLAEAAAQSCVPTT